MFGATSLLYGSARSASVFSSLSSPFLSTPAELAFLVADSVSHGVDLDLNSWLRIAPGASVTDFFLILARYFVYGVRLVSEVLPGVRSSVQVSVRPSRSEKKKDLLGTGVRLGTKKKCEGRYG